MIQDFPQPDSCFLENGELIQERTFDDTQRVADRNNVNDT